MRISLLALLFASVLLAGCTTATLEELRHAEPKGNAFQTALAKQYLVFADAEAKAYDWIAMTIFSEKGLSATYGNDPLPESPQDWNINADKLPELEAARADLMQMLSAQNKRAKPDMLAKAQFSYDCWVEQQEEGWQTDDIAACRNAFFTAMNALKGEVSEQIETSSYLVLFDFGSAKLTTKGIAIIQQVADETRDDDSDIILNGHTDNVGTERANMDLSEQRIEAVGALLIKHGIHQTRIKEFAFGESDLAVQTRDEKPEKANRRVEIFVGQ